MTPFEETTAREVYQQKFQEAIDLKIRKMNSYGVDPVVLHRHGFIGVLFELSRKGARVDALIKQLTVETRAMTPEEERDLFLDLINFSLDALILCDRERDKFKSGDGA